MVAIVSGNSLGLTNTSAGVLGGDGLFGNAATGNAGEQAYVNVATGNLVIQDQDDYLASVGTDVALTRTYNSQGVLDLTDTIKQWETGLERSVGSLVGVINTNGSTLTRTAADGDGTVFTYDASRGAYISTAGGGAFDSITYDSKTQTYTWHSDAADANSMAEHYDALHGGRITSVSEVGGRMPTDVTSGFTVATSDGSLLADSASPVDSGSGDAVFADAMPIGAPTSGIISVVTFALTNSTTSPISGPIDLSLNNLNGRVVTNATGNKNGVPYLTINQASVAPGETIYTTAIIRGVEGDNPQPAPSAPESRMAVTMTMTSVATESTTVDGYDVTVTSGYDYPVTLLYTYNNAGKIASIQDQTGDITSFHYDNLGNLTSVGTGKPAQPGQDAPAEFVRAHYSYDTLNRLTMATIDLAPEATQAGATETRSYATSYTYDGISNRVASLTHQDGSTLQFKYALTGLGVYKVSSFTDALGRQTTFAYSQNATTVTDPKGNVATYRFDNAGELLGSSVDSASGDETIVAPAYTYDAKGNVTSKTDANGTTSYTYDAVGSIVSQENPDGTFVYRTYDSANHQLSTQSVAQPKTITNGSFDSGEEGWTLVGSYGATPDPTLAAGNAPPPLDDTPIQIPVEPTNPSNGEPTRAYPVMADGVMSFTNTDTNNNSKTAQAFQSFNTIPGETYLVTVQAQADYGDNAIAISAGSAGAMATLSVDATSAGTDALVTYILRFTATDTTSSVHFDMTAAPDGGHVSVSDVALVQDALTRYIYDAGHDKPSFEITPEGRITELRYDSTDQLVATIVYGDLYPADREASSESLAGMTKFVRGLDQTRVARLDYSYDVRGLLQTTTTYAKTDATGAGIADGTASVTRFVYDQAGKLLQTIDPDNNPTTFTYDGLGRTLSTTDAKQNSSITTYDDAGNRVTVKTASGLTQVLAYDKEGELLRLTESAPDVATGTTSYTYDADGLLRITESAIGERTYMYYDAAGYLAATIDANGSVVETTRNDAHQILTTTAYATQLTQAQRNALVSSDRNNVLQPFDSVRPAEQPAADRTSANRYDTSGRLAASVDGNNALTTYGYDSRGLLVATTWYASAQGFDSAASADDRVQRNFYDNDNLLVAQLDPEGYVTQFTYDAQGWKTGNVVRAVPVAPSQQNAATLAQLGVVASAKDVYEHALYDGKGLQVGSIDGDGYLTESTYDAAGNLAATTTYASTVAYAEGATIDTLRPAPLPGDQTVRYAYNSLNQRVTATSPDGTTITRYEYNSAGNLVSSTHAAGTTAANGGQMRYDARGQLIATLGAEGVAMLPADPADRAGIDAVWTAYATTYTYDAAGERTTSTDPLGNRTVYFYDDAGRLRYTISPLGNVAEQRYTAFGQVDAIIAHAVPLASAASLAGGRITGDMQARFDSLASSEDSVQSYAYDHDGQVLDVTDAMKFITVNEYNAFGEVVRQTAVAQAGNADPATPGSASVRTVYDKDGRVAATLDALGSLARFRYDELGNVIERVAYARPIDPASTGDQIRALIAGGTLADPLHDARQMYVYNQRGLPTATFTSIDSNAQSWSASTQSYNAAGQVIATDGYATPVTGADPTAIVPPYAESVSDSGTRIVYDQNGRVKYIATRTSQRFAGGVANWALEQRQYDAAGNIVASISYVLTIYSADPATDLADIDGMPPYSPSSGDTVTRYVYDSANRVSSRAVAQDDGHWAVTRYTYDKAGNLVETVDAATALSSLPSEWLAGPAEYAAWLTAGVPANAADRATRYGYDAENRLINTLDATGALVSKTYDAKGNVSATVAYAAPLHLQGQLPQDFHVAANPAVDRIERTVYDLDNQPVVRIDALGNATGMQYDAFGNVVAMVRYAVPLVYPATAPQASPSDRVERYVYDQAQRLRYTIDAAGYVTESAYDALGRVGTTVSYGAPYGGAADLASLANAAAALAPSRLDSYEYDARGLTTLHVDPMGARESYTYDALGNQVTATNKNGVVTYNQYNSAGHLSIQTSSGYVAYTDTQSPPFVTTMYTQFDYDALGNVQARIDIAGGISRMTMYFYDRVGRQTGVSLPVTNVYDAGADPLAPGEMDRIEAFPDNGGYSSVVYDVFGDAVSSTDVLGNTTRKVYDQAGRVAADIDALGFVTLRTYDTFGDAVQVTRASASVLPALALAQGVQLYELMLGRAPEAGAAEGVAAALQAGQTFTEVANQFFNTPEGSNLYAGKDSTGIVTQLFANAVGRAPTAVELSAYVYSLDVGYTPGEVANAILHGLGAAADLQTWNAKIEAAAPTAGAAMRQRATQVFTAVMGRAPSDTELLSALQYLVEGTPEGLANKLIGSPEGQQMYGDARPVDRLFQNITGHGAGDQYDSLAAMYAANPGATSLYAIDLVNGAGGADAAYFASEVAVNTIPQSIIGAGAAQLDLAGALALLAGLPHNEDRTLVQRFDQLGHVLTITEASGLFSMATNVNGVAGFGIVQGHKQTINTYDSFGDMLSQSVGLYDDTTGIQMADPAVTRFAYNARGEKVAQFVLANTRQYLEGETLGSVANPGATGAVGGLQEDIGGYLTTMGYDADGNLIRVTEFSRLIDPATLLVNGQLAPQLFAGAVPSDVSDRETDYTYDAHNNRTSEIHLSSAIDHVTLDGAQTVRQDIHTVSSYDSMGNLLSVTDELGGSTFSYYDSIGQVAAVASSVDGVQFTLTTFDRDGFGNVLRRTDYVNGASNVTAAGYTVAAPDAANDRVTLSQYDNNGHAIVETDASGHTLYTSYDLMGRAVKQWQSLEQARLDSSTDLDYGTMFKINVYDAVGQLVAVRSSGATGTFGSPDSSFVLTDATTTFNAFGEAVQKNIDGKVVQSARYDNQGRMWLTNADDGAYKAMFYDVWGNVATVMRSDVVEGAAGSLTTMNSATDVAAAQAQFIRTDSEWDMMGRTVRVNAPGSNIYQRNDRWGNLVERTDPRNSSWSVRYTYNWRNELVEEDNVVKTASDTGWSETTSKAVSTFYDELGRKVGTRDANTNAAGTGRLTTTMTYDLQGQLLSQYNADGGLTSSAYNLFGDRTMVTVQVDAAHSNATWFGYDHLSHLIDTWTAPVDTYYLATPTDASDMHLTGLGQVQLHLHYDYDGLGNRYQTIASDGGVTRSRYDLAGNVVGTRDAAGIVLQYTFDGQHNRTGQLDGNGNTMTWQYDANGKLLSHVDLGGATVWYGYDGRGHVVSQASTARGGTGLSQDIVSTYDATGLLLTVNDRTSGILTTYTYDLAGNRTGEQTLASTRGSGALIPNGPQSPERTLVTQLYYAILGRAPEQGGLDFWVQHMREGESEVEEANDFFNSDETSALYAEDQPNGVFAATLYQQALNRAPTDLEYSTITDALDNGGSRGEAIVNFIHSITNPDDLAYFNGRVNSSLYFPNVSPTPDYGIVAQNNVNTYDNLGRITDINDGRYTVNFTYDANGNRVQVHTHYDDPAGTVDTVAVNTFDAMNRQLIVNGTLGAEGSVVIGQYGHSLTYDLIGNRTSDTYLGDPAQPGSVTRERFEYDAAGRLIFTYRTADGTSDEYMINARKYDMGSRIIETGVGAQLDEHTVDTLKAMGIEVNSRLYAYDLAGKTMRQKIFDGAAGAQSAGKLEDIYYYAASQGPNGGGDRIGYDGAGNLKGYYIVPQGGKVSDQLVYHMDYARFDGYVQTRLSVTRDDGDVTSNYRETISTYNQNGFLVQVQVGTDAPRSFISDIDGHILRATSGNEVTTTLIVNGEVLGSSGGPRDGVAGYFATNYASTTESSAATAPSVYMVEEGDTLQSIARAIWGDARLWFLIADANGIAGDAELKAGDQLVIPPKVNTVTSNYQAYKPYDPSKLIGDTTPVLPAPTGGGGGGGGGGCGFFGAIISVFVAVVAFTLLAPVGAAFVGTGGLGLTGTAASFVAGVTTGVLTSVVSQGIGIAIGTQDSFSWKGVAVSGLSAGLTQGLDANLVGGTAAAPTYAGLAGTGGVIARAAVGNALGQGVSIAVGLQDGFNWRGLVASGAAAGVGQLVQNNLPKNTSNFGVDLASHTAMSVTQQLIQSGQISATQVAADAFGNAVGNATADAINRTEFMQSRALKARINAERATRGLAPINSSDDDALETIHSIVQSREQRTLGGRLLGYRNQLELYGLPSADVDNVIGKLDDAFTNRGTVRAVPGAGSDPTNSAILTGSSTPEQVAAFGALAVDNVFKGSGVLVRSFGETLEANSLLRYGLEGIAFAAGPALFVAQKAITNLTPIGDAIENGQEAILNLAADRFSSVGYSAADASNGGLGAFTVGSLAVTGIGSTIARLSGISRFVEGVSNRLTRLAPDVSASPFISELSQGSSIRTPSIGIGANGAVDSAHLAELSANGVKFTPENIVATGRNSSGQVTFLETGNSKAGLQHIVDAHGDDFANIGVQQAKIPDVVMQAVTQGKLVGYQGAGTGRPIYEISINGQTQRIAVTTGNNGFIVGANPAGGIK